ncbi:MAG: hypothetical protein V4497_09215 [Bacteroidota bacterium]
MKTFRRFCIVALSALSFLSCNSAPDVGDDFGDVGCLGCGDFEINTIGEANTELTNHPWKMININISGSIPEWYNYNFVFKPNNSLVATYNNITYTGTWSITDDNPNQNLITDLKLNLAFSSSTIFNKMSKKWTFNSSIFDYNNGNQFEFVFTNNGTIESSFKLLEIK